MTDSGRSRTTYRRDRTGKVVHRADCRTLSTGQGTAWDYADGMTGEQMAQVLASYHRLRACKTCRPTGDARRQAPS